MQLHGFRILKSVMDLVQNEIADVNLIALFFSA
jgi:hypothetical protein